MNDAKNVHYLQKDNDYRIIKEPGILILSSNEAYLTLPWCRKYFQKEPTEGYFIYITKTPKKTLLTNTLICSSNIVQSPTNLIIIEENISAKLYNTCASTKPNLNGKHFGQTKIIVKNNASLTLNHFQNWGKKDTVVSQTDLILNQNSEVVFNQKCSNVPKILKMTNRNFLAENTSLNYLTHLLSNSGNIKIYDDTYLNGEKSKGISRIRLIGKKNSNIYARSRMIANTSGTGHVDCMGLLLDQNSIITAIPELINKNKEASLTHEASIGKISDEILYYLRSRGLTEDQAIDLVVNGFLGEDEKIIIDGNLVSSKEFM